MDANSFQRQHSIQKSDDSKSLDAKHQHPTDAKIASTNVDAKTESKGLFKVHLKVDATQRPESVDARFSVSKL